MSLTGHEVQTELCVASPVGDDGHVDSVSLLLYQPVDIRRKQVRYDLQLVGIGLQYFQHLKYTKIISRV